MDGGSTDGTVAILERYRDRLSWSSGPDGGAAAAINNGFARTTGSIVAWLNADDAYEPGAISAAVAGLAVAPEAAAIYGEGVWIDERDEPLGPYPTVMPFDSSSLARECVLCQPAVFMRREALEAVGGLDPSLHYAFDYELWIRLSRVGPFATIPVRLARSRMHGENKTLGARKQVFQENIRVLRRHYGYVPVNWVYGYLSFLRDGRDQFFKPSAIPRWCTWRAYRPALAIICSSHGAIGWNGSRACAIAGHRESRSHSRMRSAVLLLVAIVRRPGAWL